MKKVALVAALLLLASCSDEGVPILGLGDSSVGFLREVAGPCIAKHIQLGNPLWDVQSNRPVDDEINTVSLTEIPDDPIAVVWFQTEFPYPGAPWSACGVHRETGEVHWVRYSLDESSVETHFFDTAVPDQGLFPVDAEEYESMSQEEIRARIEAVDTRSYSIGEVIE